MKKKDFKAFQSSFLGKDDLTGPAVLTIKDVTEEEIQGDGGKDVKPVMVFRDHDKAFILNNINWDTIADAYGDDSDDWKGQRIEVYVDPSIMFGNKRVGGVRVRLPVNAPTGNGANSFWTLEQAVQEAAKVGITQPELYEKMKTMGLKSYKADRDTKVIRHIISEKESSESFDNIPNNEAVFAEDDIPL